MLAPDGIPPRIVVQNAVTALQSTVLFAEVHPTERRQGDGQSKTAECRPRISQAGQRSVRRSYGRESETLAA